MLLPSHCLPNSHFERLVLGLPSPTTSAFSPSALWDSCHLVWPHSCVRCSCSGLWWFLLHLSLLQGSGGMGGQTIMLVLKLHKTKIQSDRLANFFEPWIKGQRFLSVLLKSREEQLGRRDQYSSHHESPRKHSKPLPAQLFFCCYWQSRVKIKIFFKGKCDGEVCTLFYFQGCAEKLDYVLP